MKSNIFFNNNSFQQAYTYSLAEPVGRNYDAEIQPQLAPKKCCLRVYSAASTSPVAGTNSRP
jgi:hypothetical protein